MSWWLDFKKQYEPGSVLDLVVDRKVPPGFLFFKITEQIQGSLHVSELNWNFGLCQIDFRTIQAGTELRVYVIGFDDRYKKVHLTRKLLPVIEKPSKTAMWRNLSLQKEISAIVFEEFRNKVIVQLESGLFASIPLIENKSYLIGEKVRVIPVRKNYKQNIIECTLREIAASAVEQSSEIIESFKENTSENTFSSSEFYLNSYQQLSDSLYSNYFSDEEHEILKTLFEQTTNLFSKVEKGDEAIFIEFDFDSNAYNDFVSNIAPAIFDSQLLPPNYSEKDLLIEFSKFSFWYTQFELSRKAEGTDQNITEKLFSLFNESVSIRGVVSEEGALKIRNIKAKVKAESLRDKQTALKLNDVFYVNRPIVFSKYAPVNTFNKTFVHAIDNKLLAFKLFEVAKTKSLDILQKQGKDFKIFSNFLESQIDFEVKSANDTELQLSESKLLLDIQTDGISFTGKADGQHEIKVEDKVVISIRTDEGRQQSVGSGTVVSVGYGNIAIKSNVENFELVESGCFIKRISSIKQYVVQLDVLNKFFAHKLPLDTFYKVFHDKDGIEVPEKVELKFDSPIFQDDKNPQTQAVKKAVGNKNILLIQGPPGTGKTTVISEIVKQLIRRGEKILVTSQTHIAVDNVLERIKNDTRINIARVGNQDSISEFAVDYLIDEARKKFSDKIQKIVDIKIELLNHHIQGKDISEFSKNSFELPLTFDWNNIEEFILLIKGTDFSKSNLMIEALEHWKEVIAKTPKLFTELFLQNLNVLFGTCIGIATNRELSASDLFFDTVILDEAGKANISESLTAISRAKKIILVGDHKQLPPYLDKDRVEYFKKFSKDIAEHRTSDSEIKQALGASFFEYLQRDGVLRDENKVLLAVQHRMHPDIGNFISQSFYNSELENGAHTKNNIITLPEPFDKQLTFIDTSSDSSSAELFKDNSYFNQVEAEFIVSKIIPELERNNISQNAYAIVSPYSGQCEKIKKLLFEKDTHAFSSLEVATLDSFQGREYDIIIFSFTRSAINGKVGFLDDARRLNVAFSRARKKLILIGNAVTLTNKRSHFDQYYTTLFNNLWKYASRYGKTYRINELDYRRLQTSFQVGNIVKGTVKRFEPYGVLINLGSKSGLIPIKELSWDEISHATDIVQFNQEIETKIISINEKGILLSLREAKGRTQNNINYQNRQPDRKKKDRPIDIFNTEFKPLDVIDASIVKIIESNPTSLKVYVKLKYGVKGSFFTSSRNNRIKTGQIIKVIISKIDSVNQSVKCKLKV